MFVYRKYRVPVNLTAEQKSELMRLRDGQRQAYNWAMEHIRNYGWSTNSEYAMYGMLTAQRRMFGWMCAVSADVQRAGIRDAFTAAKAAERRGRGIADGLRYRSKKHPGRMVLRCGLPPVVVDQHCIKLPRFGSIRADIPNEVMEHEPRSYEFVSVSSGRGRDGRPRYVLYISCRINAPDPWNTSLQATVGEGRRTAVKGVDRGTVEPAVVVALDAETGDAVDKSCYDTASPFRENRMWYQRQQRRMSKMNMHSNRFRRLHQRIRRKMRKVANRRAYAECIAAKHICDDHGPHTIVLEDLKLGAMTRRGKGSYKKGLNREMRFVRHHAVEQRIRNRADLASIRIITVDPRHTSQECARCGHVDKESRVTRNMFKCTKCSYIQHADVNAAMVIGRRGLPQAPDMQEVGPPEVGMPFVRRELDARLNCFAAVGGSSRGRDSQAPAHHLAQGGMEKERHKVSGGRQLA